MGLGLGLGVGSGLGLAFRFRARARARVSGCLHAAPLQLLRRLVRVGVGCLAGKDLVADDQHLVRVRVSVRVRARVRVRVS